MAAHRYWMLFFDTGNSDYIAASNIEFRETMGGANICVGGTGYASSSYSGMDPNGVWGGHATWATNGGGAPAWIAYDLGVGVTHSVAEIAYTSRTEATTELQTPNTARLQYSDDNATWIDASTEINYGASWTLGETKLYEVVSPGGTRASEARVFSIFKHASDELLAPGLKAFVLLGYPSIAEQVDQVRTLSPLKRASPIDISEATVMALVKGRVADPKVRIWTFTLDGHDMVVLRLGDLVTLVYDAYSEQWVEWTSKQSGAWRANTGITWNGGQQFGDIYGSNIVAGDDTFGRLWFLDPEFPYDEAPDPTRGAQHLDFDRIVTGQVLAKGRQNIPCYAVFLSGDNYGFSVTGITPSIVLEISDDQGRNFITLDALPVETDLTIDNPYGWYSLGQISQPGRIFRITDNGVLTRIDTLEMNDDGG